MMTESVAVAQGTAVPLDLLGDLVDSTAMQDRPSELRGRLADDGYVLLRSVVSADKIHAARSEVFEKLSSVDEIAAPPVEGIATGRSSRRETQPDLGAFWRGVSQGSALRACTHGEEMWQLMSLLLGESARAHDYMFLRPGRPGLSTRLHYDLPFFARGSSRILTAWLALGEIPLEEGPLVVVEGSNKFTDLIDPIRSIDYESSASPTVQIMSDTVGFVRERESKLLASAFEPGDVIVFGMETLHGTLDNCSPRGRVRLSCDVRWQPANDPIDSRYVGDNPPGTTGAGYGELNGAKPLTDEWHTR